MDSTFTMLELEIKGEVAFVRLNRPKQLNALSICLIDELHQCLHVLSDDENVKIVVLTGNGPAFSAGGDIKEMLQQSDEEEFLKIMEKISRMVVALYTMPQLTIAGIAGSAAGLGFSLALATDHIIADENSKLAMNFIGIGLIPDGGSHFLLEKRIGETKTKQLIWEGKMMTADEALGEGLVDEVTSSVETAVANRLKALRNKPLLAMIKTKKIIAELNREKLLKTLDLEKHGQWAMRQTADHQEGVKAFIEKRRPVFKGR